MPYKIFIKRIIIPLFIAFFHCIFITSMTTKEYHEYKTKVARFMFYLDASPDKRQEIMATEQYTTYIEKLWEIHVVENKNDDEDKTFWEQLFLPVFIHQLPQELQKKIIHCAFGKFSIEYALEEYAQHALLRNRTYQMDITDLLYDGYKKKIIEDISASRNQANDEESFLTEEDALLQKIIDKGRSIREEQSKRIQEMSIYNMITLDSAYFMQARLNGDGFYFPTRIYYRDSSVYFIPVYYGFSLPIQFDLNLLEKLGNKHQFVVYNKDELRLIAQVGDYIYNGEQNSTLKAWNKSFRYQYTTPHTISHSISNLTKPYIFRDLVIIILALPLMLDFFRILITDSMDLAAQLKNNGKKIDLFGIYALICVIDAFFLSLNLAMYHTLSLDWDKLIKQGHHPSAFLGALVLWDHIVKAISPGAFTIDRILKCVEDLYKSYLKTTFLCVLIHLIYRVFCPKIQTAEVTYHGLAQLLKDDKEGKIVIL